MQNKEHQNVTEKLKQRLAKRIMLVVSGCFAAGLLAFVVPGILILVTPAPLSPLLDSSQGSVPTSALLPHPSLTWIPVFVALILLVPILYWIYDAVRIYLALRNSRQDDPMFP